MKALMLVLAITLAACTPARLVTRTQTIQVPVLKYVPVPLTLTAETAPPIKPEARCTWVASPLDPVPTLCVDALTAWRLAYADALASCNADKAAIRALKPQ